MSENIKTYIISKEGVLKHHSNHNNEDAARETAKELGDNFIVKDFLLTVAVTPISEGVIENWAKNAREGQDYSVWEIVERAE